MSITQIRKEMFWTNAFMIFIFVGVLICDWLIHMDFDKYMAKAKQIDEDITQLSRKQDIQWIQIMPSCKIGYKSMHGKPKNGL